MDNWLAKLLEAYGISMQNPVHLNKLQKKPVHKKVKAQKKQLIVKNKKDYTCKRITAKENSSGLVHP